MDATAAAHPELETTAAAQAELEATAKARAKTRQLVLDMFAAMKEGNLSQFCSFLAKDVVWYDPVMFPPPARGHAEASRFLTTMVDAFPNLRYEFRDPICFAEDGSRAMVAWTMIGTNWGRLTPPGFAATWQRFEITGVDLVDVRGGLVTRIETHFDLVKPLRQLVGLQLRPDRGSRWLRVIVVLQKCWARWSRRGKEGPPAGVV